MPAYDPNPRIITASSAELLKIAVWLSEHEKNPDNPKTVLIGGWAVDAYNPYLGSVDIDLVTNSKMKRSLMYHLTSREGYQYDSRFPFGKTVFKETPPGEIILDFETREVIYSFEGHPNLPFKLDILDGNVVTKPVRGGVGMAVPNRATLLFLKMKAAWDRGYRIEHSIPLIDPEWEAGKRVKDFADILALIDPGTGGRWDIDIEILGSLLSQYRFLKGLILEIPELPEIDAISNRYGRIDMSTIRSICIALDSIL